MPSQQNGLDALVVAKGADVFREGDFGSCAYLIERGRVEISLDRDGERVVLAERAAGEIFGEMAIIDNQPRSATVTAAEDCEFLIITREQLNRRIEDCDPILRVCLNVVLERFRATMEQLHGINLNGGSGSYSVSVDASPLRMVVDDHEGGAAAIQAIKLEREIERAIEREEFELFFQPIIDLRGGDLAGFESLVRWRHATRGLIPPMVFIPAAETSGLIVPMGRICLQQACAGLNAFADLTGKNADIRDDLFVSINLSGRDFDQDDLVTRIIEIVDANGSDPTRLKLEITETTLMQQPERAARALEECRIKGLSIAIDDFGTGYSSLGYLHRFPIDTLKIDRSFIMAMHDDQRSMKIVQTVLAMADELGIPVVAEGVETEDDAKILRDMGCEYAQGYFFARPAPRSEALALMPNWTAWNPETKVRQEAG